MLKYLLFILLLLPVNTWATEIETRTVCIYGYLHAVVILKSSNFGGGTTAASVSSNQIFKENKGVFKFKPVKCGKNLTNEKANYNFDDELDD